MDIGEGVGVGWQMESGGGMKGGDDDIGVFSRDNINYIPF